MKTNFWTNNEKHLEYSFNHRQAFIFVLNKLPLEKVFDNPNTEKITRKELQNRAKNHDMDKLFLYTLTNKADASRWHKTNSSHHDKAKTIFDLLETIIDWECAGYTKSDKPRNAYDTLKQLCKNHPHKEKLLDLMEKLGIAQSYQNTPEDQEWQNFKQQIPEYHPDLVRTDIYEWMLREPETAQKALKYVQTYCN